MAKLTVVIPFYQKQPGILRRALASVFAQTFEDLHVIVVDDRSPHPIADELAGLSPHESARLDVISQPNAGPGGARNTGLDHIPPNSEFVAFLDSDDVWTPDHLMNAFQSMTRFGADCYWSSITGCHDFYYHFRVSALEESENVTRISENPLLIELPQLQEVMLKNWSFLHISSMVIGRNLFRTVRFDATLTFAAEDVLFFCDCARAAKRVILCDAAGAIRGKGVNIFHSVDNASPQFLQQQFNTWLALDTLEGLYRQSPNAIAAIRSHKQRVRRQALWSQMGRIKRKKLPQFRHVARWLCRDPLLLGSVVELGFRKVSR